MSIEIVLNGRWFESVKDAAEAYDISTSTLRRYQKLYGMTHQAALELLIDMKNSKFKDHYGKTFGSIKEMCKYHGVTYAQFTYRFNKGFSMAECLKAKSRRDCEIVDHLGNKWESIISMCRHYGVCKNTFVRRCRKHLPLNDCLTAGRRIN